MAFQASGKKATSNHPQVVTLVVDNSASMNGAKAKDATAGVQDVVLQLQSFNLQASLFRYLISVIGFGDHAASLALAEPPEKVDISKLVFAGDSPSTNMPEALQLAAEATRQALAKCRQIQGYRDEDAPNPICIFFSDGENNGGPVDGPAAALKSISFGGGGVDVVACGIGMQQKDFLVMQTIASSPDLAVNIDASQLSAFLAQAGKTLTKNERPTELTKNF